MSEQRSTQAPAWKAYEMEELVSRRKTSGKAYLEFLRVDSLSAGLYVLPAGETDPQKPHARDEVYFVLKGRGRFQVEDEEIAVRPGSVLFVRAGVEHRFHSIEEELEILVFFEESGW